MNSRTFSTTSMGCGLYIVIRIASDGIPSGWDLTSSHPSSAVSSRNFWTSSSFLPIPSLIVKTTCILERKFQSLTKHRQKPPELSIRLYRRLLRRIAKSSKNGTPPRSIIHSMVSCPSQTENTIGTVQTLLGAVLKRCQLHIVGVP